MLLKTPENRISIIDYLEKIDEDTFIDEFVLPFFTSFGFQVYRINSHGPGERGKDIIFSRYLPHLLDSEYIAVQAKAEPIKASNVSKFAQQINRALKISFPSNSGQGKLIPNSAIFMNARRHTNDANVEFPELIENPQYVRILSQENVCDLILNYGIGPEALISKLSHADSENMSDEDKTVYTALMNEPNATDHLLDHQLPLIRHKISRRLQEMIIDAINHRWKEDPSWAGTVKPMKWFDRYFDFFTERQYPYLIDIFKELTSSTGSFKAEPYTSSAVGKITPKMLASQAKEFIYACAEVSVNVGSRNKNIALDKLRELRESGFVLDSELKNIMNKIIGLLELPRADDDYQELYEEIYQIVYPYLSKKRRTRRST
ncbi:MAG: hypothetical protein JRF35_02585 [Deltaproteobacteria bacterium]|nr:hypothetical protein [Deltaproteobacteria bacterium]